MELKQAGGFPWQPESLMTGNLAIGNLRNNLLQRLTGEKGIHAETLLALIGAIAGFAAQNAALIKGLEATSQAGAVPSNSIVLVGTKETGPFLFGNWINQYIVPESGSQFSLHGFAAGAAIQAGAKPENLADLADMFRHTSATLGSAEFGKLRVPPNHTPGLQPPQILQNGWWHFTRNVLQLKPPAQFNPEPPLLEIHWPIIAAIVAGQLIGQTKDVLGPALAYAMVMESAIIASKLFPPSNELGGWNFETRDGQLAIRRTPNP